MIGYPEAPRAWGYTRGMARAIGASLTEAVVEGWLSRAELGALVEACRTCAATSDCTTWLSRTVDASALPEFCPNASALAALKP
jgi:hypothetical protein